MVVAFKAANGAAPVYLQTLVGPYSPAWDHLPKLHQSSLSAKERLRANGGTNSRPMSGQQNFMDSDMLWLLTYDNYTCHVSCFGQKRLLKALNVNVMSFGCKKKCQIFLNETDLLLFFVVYDTVSSGLLVGQKNPFWKWDSGKSWWPFRLKD